MIQDMGNKLNAFILFIALIACNPIKKAERTILANPAASERIFRELEKTRPCANDTSFVTILDTLVTSDTITDYKHDTINNVITLKEAGKTIYKTKKVVEIKTGYIVDTRRLAIMADSLRFYKTSLDNANHTSYQYKKWLILVIIGILIYILIKLKL